MRANRVIHALTVASGGIWHKDVYGKVPINSAGRPFNILLSYYYFDIMKRKDWIKSMQFYRDITNGGRIFIDSGVYTFKVKFGFDIMKSAAAEGPVEYNVDRKEVNKFVKRYIDFLCRTQEYWDMAFDFDADYFLPYQEVDGIHENIIEKTQMDRTKFLRVYHAERENSRAWWTSMCKDSRYTHVAIGSGIKGIGHHTVLTKEAHKYKKKVHMLGCASKNFLIQVPYDTADSSSHLIGGRFGKLLTPFGAVVFNKKTSDPEHFTNLPHDVVKDVIRFWEDEQGFTIEDLKSPYNRNISNIWFMNKYWDIPYVETPQPIGLF